MQGLDVSITENIAEEMIFDADLDQDGAVSYDDLIATITIIHAKEVRMTV